VKRHAREGDPDAHLTAAGLGLGHLTDPQDPCRLDDLAGAFIGRRLGLSAKPAVDADFVQGTLDSGEFLIIELRDE
jgi:hypothetical protein